MKLSEKEIGNLLEKARYDVKDLTVSVPPYRQDIMHPVDVIEDVGIMYGYDKIEELPLTSYTVGGTFPLTSFINKMREMVVGRGYQEVFSHMLSNPETLYEKMNVKDFGTVEIENFSSSTFSAVRTWLIPILMETLSKNKHIDYPQRLFEQGLVTARKKEGIEDYERLALVSAHKATDYTEVKQIVDLLLRMAGFEYETVPVEHNSFIPGRVARVVVNGKKIGYVGEIHPEVLDKWDIVVPVAALELNLTELFEVKK